MTDTEKIRLGRMSWSQRQLVEAVNAVRFVE